MTQEQLSVLVLPFLICVILTGIHGYLGIHVLGRKVIFVDIALAQIAALGSTVAYLMGYEPHSETAYFFSLGFAVAAACVFAGTRTRHERVPQEAIIGLTYAVAQAAAVLLADVAPHGAEHLKELMEGSIVWVTPYQVKKTFIMYSCLGVFHYIFRKPFSLISLHPEEAFQKGMNVRAWDLLFYMSFGLVITSSVQIAGVLLVFCYLVAPAVFAVMFAESLGARLAIAWTLGTVVSALGLLFSYDRPSGPTIMVFFALSLIIAGIYKKLAEKQHPIIALVGALGIIVGVAFAGVKTFQHFQVPEEHASTSIHHEDAAQPHGAQEHPFGESLKDLQAAMKDEHANVRAQAALKLGESGKPEATAPLLKALQDSSDAVKENAARALSQIGDAAAVPHLQRALQVKGEDPWVHFRLMQALTLSGEKAGVPMLLEVASGHEPKMLRNEALSLVASVRGAPLKPPVDVESAEGKKELEASTAWWKEKGPSVKWDKGSKSFK